MGAAQFTVKSYTIALSAQVSDAIDITGAKHISLWVPVVTSGQLMLRGSYDTTSANFVPVFVRNGSRWIADIGAGSAAVALGEPGLPFPYIKLETAVAQAALRDGRLICKLD